MSPRVISEYIVFLLVAFYWPTPVAGQKRGDVSPAWSPDGTRVVFSSVQQGKPQVYVINNDGSNLQRITQPSMVEAAETPAWSPDGKRIAFSQKVRAQGRRKESWEIAVLDADGSNLVQLTHEGASSGCPTWSPDGRKIAFVSDRYGSKEGPHEIYVMDVDGIHVRQITLDARDAGQLAWSQDGTKIAFVSNQHSHGDDYQIYVMDADGSGLRQLTHAKYGAYNPAWLPGGRKIAYHSSVVAHHPQIWVMDDDGSNPQQVTHDNDAGMPAWSPDGKKIAFVSARDGQFHIYMMNADGSGVRRLTGEIKDVPSAPITTIAAVTPGPATPVHNGIKLGFVGEATGGLEYLLGNDLRLYVRTAKGFRIPRAVLRVVDLHRVNDSAYRVFECDGVFSMLLTADASELVVQACYQLFVLDPVTLQTKLELKQPVPENTKPGNQRLAVAPDRKRMALLTFFAGKNTTQEAITVFTTADWKVEPTAAAMNEPWTTNAWSGIQGRFVGEDRSSDGVWSCSPPFESSNEVALAESTPSFTVQREGQVVANGEPWPISEEEKRNANRKSGPLGYRMYAQCQMSRDGKHVMVAFEFGGKSSRARVYEIRPD